MRPKRTLALVASPFVAAAVLALPTVAMSQNSDASEASAAQAPNQPNPTHRERGPQQPGPSTPTPTATPKPTSTLSPIQTGSRDGRVAGRADGQDCNYHQSFAPKQNNSKYRAAYSEAYERNYDATCVEEEEAQ
ncbi:hypothetical protein [Streptomyces sp. NPDC003393]